MTLHHVRNLTSGPTVLCTCGVADDADTRRVPQEATDAFRTRFDVYFSTLQVEQACQTSKPASVDEASAATARLVRS